MAGMNGVRWPSCQGLIHIDWYISATVCTLMPRRSWAVLPIQVRFLNWQCLSELAVPFWTGSAFLNWQCLSELAVPFCMFLLFWVDIMATNWILSCWNKMGQTVALVTIWGMGLSQSLPGGAVMQLPGSVYKLITCNIWTCQSAPTLKYLTKGYMASVR